MINDTKFGERFSEVAVFVNNNEGAYKIALINRTAYADYTGGGQLYGDNAEKKFVLLASVKYLKKMWRIAADVALLFRRKW